MGTAPRWHPPGGDRGAPAQAGPGGRGRGRCRRSLVVIDTAPREAGGAAEAARLADLVMIPCRPSAIDLAAIPGNVTGVTGGPHSGQGEPEKT